MTKQIHNNLKTNIIKLKAFTMLEILMITIIVGIGLLSIVVAISKAKVITNNTKQHIIATQLAREGVEMVYQIRNTNLLKYGGTATTHCRLKPNPTANCNKLANAERLTNKNYILSGQILSGTSKTLNISDGVSTGEKIFNTCLSGGKRIDCPGLDNQTRYGKYFRIIEGKGLYIKNSNITGGDLINCPNSNESTECNDNSAKEFRFCSRVEYIGTKTGSVEICGVLTNFFD